MLTRDHVRLLICSSCIELSHSVDDKTHIPLTYARIELLKYFTHTMTQKLSTSLSIITLARVCNSETLLASQNIGLERVTIGDLHLRDVIDMDKSNLIMRTNEEWESVKSNMNTPNPNAERFDESDLGLTNETILAVISGVKTEV